MAATAGEIIIEGVKFMPKELKVEYESLQSDESGRTLDGKMHIYWVRRNVKKISITMPPCTTAEVNKLLHLVQGQEYTIEYWDAAANASVSAHVYTSTSSADCYSGVLKGGLWQNVSFNAIEL